MMTCDTEWRVGYNNRSEAVVSDCPFFFVAIFFLCLVLQRFSSTLAGVLTNSKIGGNTKYVLMGFKFFY